MATQNNSKALHISLWVAQCILAAFFLMLGFMKITLAPEKLIEAGMGFVAHWSESSVRLIGIVEILGGLGLILPSLLRILPFLTPLSAIGISAIMGLAIQEHLSQGEPILMNIAFLVMAIFVVWGRLFKTPIPAKA